jgi:hypothetical protein
MNGTDIFNIDKDGIEVKSCSVIATSTNSNTQTIPFPMQERSLLSGQISGPLCLVNLFGGKSLFH